MAIKFNSIDSSVFNANAPEFTNVEKERANIVTCGRLLMQEYGGKANDNMRALRNLSAEYTPQLTAQTGMSYADFNRKTKEKMLLYAAKRYCAVSGEVAPVDYADFMKKQQRFMTQKSFLHLLSGIVRDVISPVLPATMSNAMSWFAETVSVPLGKTYELDVASNDIFVFEDDSWGASRSKPSNYLYSKPLTLNPTLRTAKATIKWYQLVGNDADLGRFFNSFAVGMYSKIMALAMKALVAGTANTNLVPTNLQFTNTSANWVTAAKRVAMANNTSYRGCIAVGDPSALTKALPSGNVNASTVNLDAALATMLGIEWARYGYLGEYMGINLMPLEPALVPGTQNTTLTSLVPEDKIWIMATAGYRPVYVGLEDGGEIQVELSPSQTADMTIDIITSISVDAIPAFASKVAVITA